MSSEPGGVTGAAGQSGSAGSTAYAGTGGTAGSGPAGSGSAGLGGTSGVAGTNGEAGVGGVAGTSGNAGGGTAGSGTSGAAGTGAAGSGVAGTSGAAGAGGTGGRAGTGGGAGTGGAAGTGAISRAGMKSKGCGKEITGASTTAYTSHRIAIPPCSGCTVPNCPRDCIAPPFVPGGVNAQTAANGETFVDRDFTIMLPKNYDPNVATPVFFGADGCGPKAPQKGVGFQVAGEDNTIRVGMQQIGDCFADGGIRCAPNIANVGECVNGPEIPYFRVMQKWVEDNFCVDMGKEYIGGGSSGAWEAMLIGCASADTVRGFYSVAGGLREHRWACNGKSAAFMIVTDVDTLNPVGPLTKINVAEDSFGAAPSRDEILKRNGCAMTSKPFDAKYPSCVKYDGCPAAYPVVWCEFTGGAHDNPTFNNVNYGNAVAPFLLGLPPAP